MQRYPVRFLSKERVYSIGIIFHVGYILNWEVEYTDEFEAWWVTLSESEQISVAKLERRTDMYISTLRTHIEAMGGQLEVIARFPEGSVRINNFSELGVA